VKPALSAGFTLYCYDRRGRGDSQDRPPYAVEREVEDLDAVVSALGEPVLVYGHSSGGALGLEAAARGVAVRKLAVYEPPYTGTEGSSLQFADSLAELVASGRESEAAEQFILNTGAPQQVVDGMKASPWWSQARAMAHTLVYEVRLCNDGSVPAERLAGVTCPTLAMAGSRSADWARQAADAIAAAVREGDSRVVDGQDHGIPGEVLAPILEEFFL
jgi:pimeloyl-ACP methyl ester carboxylesterase